MNAPVCLPVSVAPPVLRGWSHVDTPLRAGRDPVSLRLHRYRWVADGPHLRLDALGARLSDSRWLPSPTVRSVRLSSLQLAWDSGALFIANRSRLRLRLTRRGLEDLAWAAEARPGQLLEGASLRPATVRRRIDGLNLALLGCTREVHLAWLRTASGPPVLLRLLDAPVLQPRFYRSVRGLSRDPSLAGLVVKAVDVDPTRCLVVLSDPSAPAVERHRLLLDRFSPLPWT